MLQSGAHVGNRDFEEAKRCAKENLVDRFWGHIFLEAVGGHRSSNVS